ncbi:hypothetical protein KUTeg_000400 [Tegillarca granosa]|uniref:EF-hand domain-containing protein n=1 Tax=Tegillarca granosa TaxID=220873 RepID=A0ABQ9FXI8_TEGGR|nr:hypothetical protein KUTeg_000400 [Tegillarca granosa]
MRNVLDNYKMGLVCSRKSKFTVGEGDKDNDGEVQESKPLTIEDIYLKAEFTAMDRDKDGLLTVDECIRLIQFLGYITKRDYMRILGRDKSDGNPYVTIDEYFKALKGDPDKDILRGFNEMGICVDDELKAKIDKMDTNKDGKIQYIEFLEAEFKKI